MEVRRNFVIALTEILAQTYDITDDTVKLSIFTELTALGDSDLIAKKDLIEIHLEQSTQLTQAYLGKIIRAENEYTEAKEKKDLAFIF